MQNRPSNSYFHFTAKERNGSLFLLIVIFLLILLPFVYPLISKKELLYTNDFKKETALLQLQQKDSQPVYPSSKKFAYHQNNNDNWHKNEGGFQPTIQPFKFDPNTLDMEGWKSLGVKEKTIQTIQRYISKGGKFRKPEDIEKIWGLNESLVKQLIPYVEIAAAESASSDQRHENLPRQSFTKKEVEPIDINNADSIAWVSLPGIGPSFSGRIIRFRQKLGGFNNIEQVAETFGLPDSVFQKIKPLLRSSGQQPLKININTANLDELKQHPYIRYNNANLIVQYRTQHGNYTRVEDIKKIMVITEEQYSKMVPYLTVD